MEIVSPYASDASNESGSSEHTPLPVQRRQKRSRQWKLQQVFANKQEATDYVRNENKWSLSYSNKTTSGTKSYFRCNQVRQRGPQCDAGLYLHFVNSSLEVQMFKTENVHTCSGASSQHGLSVEAKTEIGRLLDLRLKPKLIFEQLNEKGIFVNNRNQVNNYLQQLRVQKFGPTSISIGQLESWCEEHSQTPEHIDEAFVFAYNVKDSADEEIDFKICISTKRMLQHASNVVHLHADATYKLNWEGFPVLIVGTTDKDRHFHPISISICSNEQMNTFKFIFESLKITCSISPMCLVSDASTAIREAFVSVFGPEVSLIMCWAHMRRNVIKRLCLADESLRSGLIEDIELLQLSPEPNVFSKAVSLFIKKYSNIASDFIDYMNTMWFSTHSDWFEGASLYLPSTNNALESFNLVIKREETLRERMPLSQFMNQSLSSASRWSRQYSLDKVIATQPSIELFDWTSAYHWAKSSKEVKSKKFKNFIEYYCPSGESLSVSAEDIKRVKGRKWSSFDMFSEQAFKLWIVQMTANQWNDARCTCPNFLKKYKCKHVIGLAIRLQYVKPPPAVKQTPIGQKRKRGRPKQVTKALRFD